MFSPYGTCGFQLTHRVVIYKSVDLDNWSYVGEALPEKTRPPGVYFRPKVVFNPNTREYVLWVNHLPMASSPLAGYPNASYVVAVSDSPESVFRVVNKAASTGYTGGGDFTIFVDTDGTGYLAYDAWENDHQVSIEQVPLSLVRLSMTLGWTGVLELVASKWKPTPRLLLTLAHV